MRKAAEDAAAVAGGSAAMENKYEKSRKGCGGYEMLCRNGNIPSKRASKKGQNE